MSNNRFRDRLTSHRCLVADGAMGTALFDLGLEPGGCPEMLNVDQPDLIEKVHRGYVEAGADIVLTNTFGGNQSRLELHKAGHRVDELNRAAVDLARRVADRSERDVIVAGSVGPTGDLYVPIGPLDHDTAVAIFAEQMDALEQAGADVIWIETISSFEELDAACAAAQGRGIPFTTTLSFDTNGHTMMGVSPDQFAEWWAGLEQTPAAIGANCGVGPADVVQAAARIHQAAPDVPVIAKGNCGIPLYKDEALTYPSGPESMVDYAELAERAGATIIGSCCGSGFDHVAAIRRTVDAEVSGPIPDIDEIRNRLGDVAIPTPPESGQRRHRRSRRRNETPMTPITDHRG